jgi:predicted nucleic acid-binding protein
MTARCDADLGGNGYYEPRWSSQILDEMRRNVLADHPATEPRRFDATTIAALRAAFPEALVDPAEDLIATMDNEPGDRHVLATAIATQAHLVVTANVTDFRSSRFVTSGRIAIETPTDFLTAVLESHPDLMATALLHLATRRRGTETIADVLDQLARNRGLRPFVDLARHQLL